LRLLWEVLQSFGQSSANGNFQAPRNSIVALTPSLIGSLPTRGMTLFQVSIVLLPVHHLSTPVVMITVLLAALVTATSAVLLLPSMISLLVLVILHRLVDMQILHAPPVLTHPCNKLSEEAQALTMVTMSVFPFITRPVMVPMMRTTTTVQASGINTRAFRYTVYYYGWRSHFTRSTLAGILLTFHSFKPLTLPLVFSRISADCLFH